MLSTPLTRSGRESDHGRQSGDLLINEPVHEDGGQVTDLQMSSDRTYFITASKDKTAKVRPRSSPPFQPIPLPITYPYLQLISARDLTLLKTYPSDTPLNTAAITPKKPFVILGGGQAAMDVTTTSSRQGKFEARFYHKVFEDEIGRVKGHFGPLNTVAVDPLGRGYASGGEDGYVRVHAFDRGYFDFGYEVEREMGLVGKR